MRFKTGKCTGQDCIHTGYLANATRMLCRICNEKRLAAKRKPKVKNPFKLKKKPHYKKWTPRKATGERELFLAIWEIRPHVCTNCGIYLGDEPLSHFFAHIIPKSHGKIYRLNPANVRLLCLICHQKYDQGTKEQFNQRTKV